MDKRYSDLIIADLSQRQILTPAQLARLQAESQQSGKDILDLLQEKKAASEEEIVNSKSRVLNIPIIDLMDVQVDAKILNIISEEIARNYNLVPFAKEGDKVKVAMINPQDYKAIETLDFLARQQNLQFEYYLTTSVNLNHILRQYANLTQEVSEVLESAEDLVPEEIETTNEEDMAKMKSAPVSKTVSVILRHAIEGGASDIHIEPTDMQTRVRYRVDGILHTSLILPIKIHPAVVARIKVLANLKLDETRLPQDGRFKIKFENRNVEFRVSTLPLLDKEKVVMRILDTSQQAINLENLGFVDRNYAVIKEELKKPHGLLLVTGPTGSGKSTTLYSMLTILNQEGVNIVTLEDPVEYNLSGVAQAQIRPEVGLTFASGLRSILRQDPDIIMVGEIRDKETAELVIHSALTGHIVLSTLHTNDAFGAIPRLMDMGIESFLISSSLNVVVAQRLVRRLCTKCQAAIQLPPREEEEIFTELSKIPARSLPPDITLARPLTFYKGQGCTHCEQSGYHSRLAIVEVMAATEELKKIIADGHVTNIDLVKGEFIRQGMLTMKQDGIIKAMRGLTTIEEMWNATKD